MSYSVPWSWLAGLAALLVAYSYLLLHPPRWFHILRVGISVRSGHIFTYRRNENSILPTLQIKSVRCQWNGWKAGSSILAIVVNGLVVRVKADDWKGRAEKPAGAGVEWTPPKWIRIVLWSEQRCPIVSSLLSLRLLNSRVISDDHEGIECFVKSVDIGIAVQYSGEVNRYQPSYLPIDSLLDKAFYRSWGRAHGSVSHTLTASALKLLLPNASAAATGLSKSTPPPCLSDEAGSTFVAGIAGLSKVEVLRAFGPGKGLMSEDIMAAAVTLSAVLISVVGLDGVREVLKRTPGTGAAERRETKAKWRKASKLRLALRITERATISIAKITIIHHLPKRLSRPSSASSSSSSLTATAPTEEPIFTLSLGVDALSVELQAANPSNNLLAKDAFGSNSSPLSLIRGVGASVRCTGFAVQCISPGEGPGDRTQLIAIRQIEADGFSSWKPTGWSGGDLLYVDDLNNSLVIGRGGTASFDVAADLQLVDELKAALLEYGRSSADHVTAPIPTPSATLIDTPLPTPILYPRLQLCFVVGTTMVAATDRRTTLSISSDGCQVGYLTLFEDIVARRKLAEQRRIFSDEEELHKRRAEAGDEFNAALPSAMLRPHHRRNAAIPLAVLHDDLSFRMRIHGHVEVQPIVVHLNIDDAGRMESYEMATVGRIHGNAAGSVAGRTEGVPEAYVLDGSTMSVNVGVGVEGGMQASLSELPVITALVAMGENREHSPPQSSPLPATTRPLLDRLPAGISLRLSLGPLSAFLGHVDPNPACQRKLVRGLWLQTGLSLEHAFYTLTAQYPRDRARLSESKKRADLHLREDITAQAIAYSESMRLTGGRAALTTVGMSDLSITPIFNGRKFQRAGGVRSAEDHPASNNGGSQLRTGKGKAGQEEKGRRGKEPRPPSSRYPSSGGDIPSNPNELYKAPRPLLRLSQANLNIMLQEDTPGAQTAINVTGKTSRLVVAGDMSHVYCGLVANFAIRRISTAWQRPSLPRPSSSSSFDLSISVKVPAVNVHFTFPLHEQITLEIGSVLVEKPRASGLCLSAGRMMLFVRSRQFPEMWDELGRIKDFAVTTPVATTGQSPFIGVSAECFRLRIPYGYKLADLILNVNVSIKSLSRLSRNFRGGEFWTKHEPRPEQPKRVPNICISFTRMAVEAMDDPLEAKLKIIFRAGRLAKERHIELEDMLQRKLDLMEDPEAAADDPKATRLTANAKVSFDEARYRLDWHQSREWFARYQAAAKDVRDREADKRSPFYIRNTDGHLDIKIVEREPAPPLFRILFEGVKLDISSLTWSREETVDYMSRCSLTPFLPNVEFSLMVPLNLKWTMDAATFTLRDYPLPLIRIRSSNSKVPAWSMDTPFIIAEDYHGPDTWFDVRTEIVPPNLGESGAAGLSIEVFKTISPVKTYTQPIVKIQSDLTSEFAWGNSYQPAIQDMMKVMDTISHSPKDPSEKPGFWDKFRLILHWKVQVDFSGPVHLHTKGSSDPYSITGHGAGFAFAWRNGTRFRIGFPNEQYELIQAESDELMVVIPDLVAADNATASDKLAQECNAVPESHKSVHIAAETLIQQQYTKPCARFVGGIRIGFGFRFERTCRPWNCTVGCGETDKLARRQCRMFEFKAHQDVILRNPEAVEELAYEQGHTVDSFDKFRSDFVHFSISCVSTKTGKPAHPSHVPSGSAETSSLHFSPKASAHFFAWWNTFSASPSLPIRKGSLFPNSPPPSKKFGRHLGTIKYRMDLSDVYVSHVYNQVVKSLWEVGKSQYLGVKGHFGRVQVDGHQRLQEQVVRHEKLNRIQIKSHKVFYAVEILLDGVVAKGVIAEFVEASLKPNDAATAEAQLEESPDLAYVSELSEEQKKWYNFCDYIDADRKPFDENPKIQVVDLADCPQLSYGKRLRAHAIASNDDDSHYSLESFDIETTKFGHEETHICNLGASPSVAATQIKLAELRMAELTRLLVQIQDGNGDGIPLSEKDCKARKKSIQRYIDHLRCEEKRHMDGETLQSPNPNHDDGLAREDDDFFRNQIFVHSPRIILTNTTRKLAERYFYSRSDRVQEERMVANTALREVRRGIARIREQEHKNIANPKSQTEPLSQAFDLEREIDNLLSSTGNNSRLFRLPSDIGGIRGDRRLAAMGIPVESTLVSMTNITLLKPQIVLRSEVDDDSIVLLAVEEIAFRGYDVVDVASEHRPAEQILSRNFVFLKGLQAFYPTEENVRRSKAEAGTAHSLGFLPLEIFLDDKNEAMDYHRIVSRTDAGVSMDMFNRLRLPRGVEWPRARDDNGMLIEHLRLHQDLYNIVLPQMTVSSTSKHYAALYNIATNLLLYQDPRHAERSKRIDSFLLAFDRKDRDPVRTIMDLFHQQQATIQLSQSLLSYEAQIDELNDQEKLDLFQLRNELLEHMEQLFTVFDAIAIATKREKARASQVHSSRVNIMAGNIAWAMNRDDYDMLLKFEITGTVFSYISNKDGSTDQALRITDLTAGNPRVDAHFTEVFTRLDVGGQKTGVQKAFASAAWSVASPVGGIPIWKEARAALHPIRIALEEKIAYEVVDYIFPNRAEGRGRKQEKEKGRSKAKGKGSPDGTSIKGMTMSSSTLELPPLTRSHSAVSVSSMASTAQARSKNDEKFTLVSTEDADIMRQRASARNFHSMEVMSTVISLSYKGDSSKKRKLSMSIPDCVDFRIRTGDLRYNNKILTFSELFDLLKAACIREAWAQTGSLIGQVFSKSSMVKSKSSLDKRFRSLRSDVPAKLLGSKLTYEVEYPISEPGSPLDGRTSPIDSTNPLRRVLSRKSPRASGSNGDGLSLSPILATGSRRLSVGGRETAARDLQSSQQARSEGLGLRVRRGSDEEELEGEGDSGGDGVESRVGKVKGFLGRLGRRKDLSSDDLSVSPVEKRAPRSASSSSSLQTPMAFPSYH